MKRFKTGLIFKKSKLSNIDFEMNLNIIPYQPQYRSAFKALNIWWVEKYFKVEPIDLEYLDNPEEKILNKGGYIYFALLNEKPVGACALIKMDEEGAVFELSKMGVLPEAQGHKIGWKLGQAVIEKAKAVGAKKLYLESNTVLTPAMKLYKKLGFKRLDGYDSPYERCNIAMELVF